MLGGMRHVLLVMFLCWSNGLFASNPISPPSHPDWEVIRNWEAVGDKFVFEVKSQSIIEQCRERPRAYLTSPFTVQVTQTVSIDGVVVLSRGQPQLSYLQSYFGSFVLPCSQVRGTTLTWIIYSDAEVFARVHTWPYLSESRPWNNFFNETLNIVTAGLLPFIALLSFILFYGKIEQQIVYSLALSCLLHALYFASTVPEFFNITLGALTLQKIGDTALWLGVLLMVNCFRLSGLVNKRVFFLYAFVTGVSGVLILAASTLDAAQMGTSIPFPVIVVILSYALVKEATKMWTQGVNRHAVFVLSSLAVYIGCSLHDILTIEGVFNHFMIYSIGVVFSTIFYTLHVNLHITQTYQERDHLRQNLEAEIRRVTLELKEREADLIQAEKMASLGTLSAGIAHEINNALNWVNGSVKPLRAMLANEPINKAKANRLLDLAEEGLTLTFGIIESLRKYTGNNQAKYDSIDLHEIVETVHKILNSKLTAKKITFQNYVAGIRFEGEPVMMNQIVMNLLANAIDAIDQPGGNITVDAKLAEGMVHIRISDNGCGIPKEHVGKIFDPFFTTKPVGAGTGLGLHIVAREVARMQGTINVESEPGQGTTFIINLPAHAMLPEPHGNSSAPAPAAALSME